MLASIQLPQRFSKRLSYQIWFYSGVQAGLDGRVPEEAIELKQRYGTGIAAAYSAGIAAGEKKRAGRETPGPEILVPERYSRSLQEKNWFLKGVEDAIGGQSGEPPPRLTQRGTVELLQAYRAGYQTGERRVG